MAKPVVTICGLPSFLDEPESEYSLDEQYPDGNVVHEVQAALSIICGFGDPAILAEVRERLIRCTTLDEIEQILEMML
jgi:hypothetical protein